MISVELFGYIVDRISEIAGRDSRFVQKFTYGKKFSQGVHANLCAMFEDAVCRGKDKLMMVDGDYRLWVYNGKFYEQVEREALTEICKRVLVALKVGVIYQQGSAYGISANLFNAVKYDGGCMMSSDKRYIGFANGVFDLKDGKLKDFSPRYIPAVVLDFDYNEQAGGLIWEIKLKEIIPCKGLRDAFQQFCGALLVKRSEVKFEYLCYLLGSGANGKSVLASAVSGVFGSGYVTGFTPRELFSEGSSSMFNRSALVGKLLNVVDDLDDKDFSGGAMKKFISGEPIITRAPHARNYITIDEPPLMLCCANHIPDTSDDSYGHHRRQLIIETTSVQYGLGNAKRDPMLSKKLRETEVRQRIFNWIYAGYKKLMGNGGDIKLDEDALAIQAKIKSESSSMRRWVMDMGIMRGDNECGCWMSFKSLYEHYREYCVTYGYAPPKAAKDVSEMLLSIGCEKKRSSGGFMFFMNDEFLNKDRWKE